MMYCFQCNKWFQARSKRALYCSNACRQAHYRLRAERKRVNAAIAAKYQLTMF